MLFRPLKTGANPYLVDNEGFTALHHACVERSLAVIKYLLKVAPDLLLTQGKLSLACPAPCIAMFDTIKAPQMFPSAKPRNSADVANIFLQCRSCPPAIKFDINVLRIIRRVFLCHFDSSFQKSVNFLKKLIESDIEPIVKANGGVPVSSPRDVVKEKYQLALLKSIKSIDPDSHVWDREMIQQCLLILFSYYRFSSLPLMWMLSDLMFRLYWYSFYEYNVLHVADPLSRMLCFRLESTHYICLSEKSLSKVLIMSTKFISSACAWELVTFLNLAINIFSALVNSLEGRNVCCRPKIHSELHFCSRLIYAKLISIDSQREAAILMTKFVKCNPPLIVNDINGYPESLLHIVLSSQTGLTSPLLQTFLHSGGDRWINTPGVNGRRPLHLDVPRVIADLLIDYGAHLDAVDADGSTPEYSNEYFKYNPSPLSCIAARSIAKSGGLTKYESSILSAQVQAFISLHDGHATRAEVNSKLL